METKETISMIINREKIERKGRSMSIIDQGEFSFTIAEATTTKWLTEN